ncbi:MAG: glycerophosphodiester phosphodiesterase family protein [Gammaproteobacteria bacterium]
MRLNRFTLVPLTLFTVFSPLSVLADASGHSQHDRPGHEHRTKNQKIQLGPRPFFLVDKLPDGELKDALQQCTEGPFYKTDFAIGHRGAALQFPEHSKESYQAAARMGAGIVECDVTFTKDKELVCRHSQCDLYTTTNILATELAEQCTTPPDFNSDKPFANVQCCTSDITLAEFKTLKAKMDAGNPNARTVEEFMSATPNWRTDLYSADATVMSHAESIELFKQLGVKMTPELKTPSVSMPYKMNPDDDNETPFTQALFAQKMLDEYKAAGVKPEKVYAQSFDKEDILYWLANEPEFGKQAVFLDDVDTEADLPQAIADLDTLANDGVKIVAPPLWALVTLDANGNIVPSAYALAAKAAGLGIITWTLERSGLLKDGGGWYYQTITDAVDNDGDALELLDVLAKDVGILGIFSDWPATVTYYANCMNRK